MNFELISGELTPVEEKDILKMLRNKIRLAFKNGNEYNIQERNLDIRTVKIVYYCEVKKRKEIKAVKVMFNLNKKKVA